MDSMLPASFSFPSSWDARYFSAKSCPVMFSFFFLFFQVTHANSWQPPSQASSQLLVGSSGAGCCSRGERCCSFIFKVALGLEPYSVGRKEPFHIGVQLSRKRRKKLCFHTASSILGFQEPKKMTKKWIKNLCGRDSVSQADSMLK